MVQLISRALLLATNVHAGQQRKYNEGPYILHPIRVANKVAEVNKSPKLQIVALLHDSIEDGPVWVRETIKKDFGDEILNLVEEVTDKAQRSDGNRHVRKAINLQHLKDVSGDAQTVKLADIIDNLNSLMKSGDDKFLEIYMTEKHAQYSVLTRGNCCLRLELYTILEGYFGKRKMFQMWENYKKENGFHYSK